MSSHNNFVKSAQLIFLSTFFVLLGALFSPFWGVNVAHAIPAGFSGGDGSPGNPYQISNCSQFELINSHLSANFILVNSIDCSSDANNVMIYNRRSVFTGTFNGGGNTINLVLSDGGGTYNPIGLFQKTDGASIHDLNLTGTIDSKYDTGALIGNAFSTEIDNVHSSVAITVEDNGNSEPEIGGLVGYASNTSISRSSVSGNIEVLDSNGSGSVDSFGGLVGYLDGASVVTTSYATGNVTMDGVDIYNGVGGLVGYMNSASDISQSYASSQVVGIGGVGGFIGYLNGGTIEDSYASSTVSGIYSIGGFVGYVDMASVISRSYAVGTVSGGGSVGFGGGFVGGTINSTISDSFSASVVSNFGQSAGFVEDDGSGNILNDDYYDQIKSGQIECAYNYGNFGGCSSADTISSPDLNLFKNTNSIPPVSNWDFSNTWDKFGDSYPTLHAIAADDPTVYFDNGDGSSENPYQISSCSEFENINQYLSASFILTSDLYCGGESTNIMVATDYRNPFTGNFDGQGHSIDLGINDSAGNYTEVGLFSYVNGATISNLNLSGSVEALYDTGVLAEAVDNSTVIDNVHSSVNVTIDNNGDWEPQIGGLVARLRNNSTISNSSVTGSLTSSDSAEGFGGLVGQMDSDASIVTSYVTGNVTMNGTDVDGGMGGLVGCELTGSDISESYSSGVVSNNVDVSTGGYAGNTGGFVGYIYNSTIEDSYSISTVNAETEAGGFVGYMNSAWLSRTYATGAVTGNNSSRGNAGGLVSEMWSSEVDSSFSIGAVSGFTNGYAGFIGEDQGNNSLTSNYYNKTSSGQTECISGEGNTSGKCYGIAAVNSDYFKGNISNPPFDTWGFFGVSGRTKTGPAVWDSYGGFFPTLHNISADDPDVSSLFSSGSGVPLDPYHITTCTQFENINSSLSSSYVIDNDLHCESEQNNIMIQSAPALKSGFVDFTGTLDGGGHTIYVAIDDSGDNYENVGLFQTMTGATVHDLNIAGTINAYENTGALTGIATGADITNVNSSVNVTIYDNGNWEPEVGGLVGDLNDSTVSGSSVAGNVIVNNDNGTGSADTLGGLVGYVHNGSAIDTSYVTGNITMNGDDIGDAGGFGGYVDPLSQITESYATGTIASPNTTGGFIGGDSGLIQDSYARGNVNGDSIIGGFAGRLSSGAELDRVYATGSVTGDGKGSNGGGLIGDSQSGTINDSFSIGGVSNFKKMFGGFVGTDESSKLSDNFYDQNSSGQRICESGEKGTTKGCTSVDTSHSPDANYFIGNSTNPPLNHWDFSDTPIWDVTPTFLPTLHAISADDVSVPEFAGGSGINGDPYQITTCAQFENVKNYMGAYFELENDIDCSDPSYGNNIMVGNGTSPFTGVFNGQGHTITIALSDPDGNFGNFGLFPLIFSADISNLNVAGTIEAQNNTGAIAGASYSSGIENVGSSVNITIDSNNNAYLDVGGLVGYMNYGGISQSYTTGTMISNGTVNGLGGLVGEETSNATITTSYTTGNVTLNNGGPDCGVGGLVGCETDSSDINQSYAKGDVVSLAATGGLVGDNWVSSIDDSYATGDVSGQSSIGGLAGNTFGTISRSYSTGSVTSTDSGLYGGGLVGVAENNTFNDSFTTGAVSGFIDVYGGFVGYDAGGNTFNDNFFDQTTTGQTVCSTQDAPFPGCAAVNTDGSDSNYFKNNNTNQPLSNWDFTSTPVWDVYTNSFPTLHAIVADDPSGEFSGGSGVEGDPFLISTCAEFESINNNLSAYYSLQHDLTCTSQGNNIMVSADSFTGNFEGNNHTITVAIDDTAGNFEYVGLFQTTAGNAVISDLTVAGSITALYNAGSLVGAADSSEFDNDSASTTITILDNGNTYPNVGGLIGDATSDSISNGHTTGVVVSNGSIQTLGGFVGVADNDTTIISSYSNSSVTMNSSQLGMFGAVGGFAGVDADGSFISQSYATGAVASPYGAGGFVGLIAFTGIEDSYATGAVSGSGALGGFAAWMIPSGVVRVYATGSVTGDGNGADGGALVGGASDASIYDSFATGAVSNFTGSNAGIVGSDGGGNSYLDDYYDQISTGQSECVAGSGDFPGCVGVDTSSSPNSYYFKGNNTNPPFLNTWDFTSESPVWDMNPGFFPTLHSIPADDPNVASLFSGGDGTSDNPFHITNCASFENINAYLSSNFVLENSIDCSSNSIYRNNAMIGTPDTPFTGTFDGNGYSISVAMSDPSGQYDTVGLFRNTDGAMIQNLTLTGTVEALYDTGSLIGDAVNTAIDNVNSSVTITIDDNDFWDPSVGGLIGYVDGGMISNSFATGDITVNTSGSGSVEGLGGFVGYTDSGAVISTSYSTGTITMNGAIDCAVGGFVGCEQGSSTISQSYSMSPVNAPDYVGGFVGYIGGSVVTDSYSTGAVYGLSDLAGFVGFVSGGQIDHSYSSSSVTSYGPGNNGGGFIDTGIGFRIYNSFAVGNISNFDGGIGGFIANDPMDGSLFVNDYFDETTTGQGGCSSNSTPIVCSSVNTDGTGGNYFLGNTTNAPLNTWDFSGAPIWSSAPGYLPNLYAISADDPTVNGSYRFIKWEITQKKVGTDVSCSGNGCIQVGEFIPTEDGSPVSWPIGTTATNPNGSSPDGQGPDKAIDGVIAYSKWLDYNFANGNESATSGDSVLLIDTGIGNSILFNGYRWFTGDDQTERDPVGWRLYGSNDGTTWDLLDVRKNQTITDLRSTETDVYALHGGSFSRFAGGLGTADSPFQITTCAQFEAVNNFLSAHYILENDIDCSIDANNVMVGTSTAFSGVFDGNEHTITVAINDSAGNFDQVGLFQNTNNANIHDLNIAGTVEALYDTGALVGSSVSSEFDSDSSSASITIDDNGDSYPQIGGLIGHLVGSTISSSHTTGNLISNGSIGGFGGLVGMAEGGSSITTSYATGNVTNNSGVINYGAGGLLGILYNGSDLSQSYATGIVSSPDNAGGLMAFVYLASVEDSYATGAVNGENSIGGFTGNSIIGTFNRDYASGSVTGGGTGINGAGFVGSFNNTSTINDSFSVGAVSGFSTMFGGFTGYDDESNTYTNDYYDQTASMQGSCLGGGGDASGCIPVDTSGSPDINYFKGNHTNEPLDSWDFDSTPIWDVSIGYLPTLHAIAADDHHDVAFDGGDGSSGNPYQISTCDQLQAMNQHLSSDFILDADVNCVGSALWNPDSSEWVDGVVGGELIPDDYASSTHTDIVVTNNGYYGFQPVGDRDNPFTGNLDGNNKTISNLWIFRKSTSYNGIFGKAANATISNLTISNSNIVGGSVGSNTPPDYNNSYTAALVGYLDGGNISNITLNNNLVRAYLSYYGGGLVGWSNNVAYSNIVNKNGFVHGSGDIIGGLVGYLRSGSLSDSSSSADVDGGWEIGGIVGDAEGGVEITNVHSSGGTVTSNRSEWVFTKTGYNAGGFAGFVGDADIYSSYSSDNVNSSGFFAGGFAGEIDNSVVTDSYASGNVTAVEETNDQGTFDPDYVGGFTGYIADSLTSNLFATGNVSSPGSHVGGFTGYVYGAVLEDEYATGNVSGNSYVGGFAGDIYGEYSINQVYSVGQVTGVDTDTTGGLIGANDGSGTLNPSFWDVDTSQKIGSAGGTGTSTLLMKTESTYTKAGWDFGSTWDINGSVNNGYPVLQSFQPVTHITSCDDIGNINDNLSGSYVLDNDITCSRMIGDNSNAFTGGFDGGGHTITLAINDTAGNYYQDGLFSWTRGATISNLNLAGSVEVIYDAGSLIGDSYSTMIDNVHSSANVIVDSNDGWEPYIGGLVGYIQDTAITNSSSTGFVTSSDSAYGMGGLVGYSDSSLISTSYATGNVTMNGSDDPCGVGGFVGCEESGTDISQSYSTGIVTGQVAENTGGFAGMVNNASIEDSYTTGNVIGESDIGGFAGLIYDASTVANAYASGSVTGDGDGQNGGAFASAIMGVNTINNSFAVGRVMSMENFAGGFTGIDAGSNNYNNDYFDLTTTGQSSCVSSGGLDGCSTVNTDGTDGNYFKNNSTNTPLNNWDFSSTPVWDAYPNMLPTLHAISADDPNIISFDGGDGSGGNPYQISTCEQVQAINEYLSSSFILEQSIDCSSSGNNIMIGLTDPFTGTFDGNGNTITVRINDSSGNFSNVGLFAQMSSASVSNLNIAGSVETQDYAGALAGDAEFSTFNNDSSSATLTIDDNGGYEPIVGGLVGEFNGGAITNSYTSGDMIANGSIGVIGGLVGEDDSGATVSTSYSTGNVTVNNSDVGYAGGLVGFLHNTGDISQSYATGNVSAINYAGGLVGGTQVATIEDSYATGDVSGQSYLGGFVGNVWNSDIERSYSTGTVTGDSGVYGGGFAGYVTGYDIYYSTLGNSFSTGAVLGYDGNSGGFAGYSDGSNAFNNDYYDQTGTGQSECVSGLGDFEGCTSVNTSDSPDAHYFKGNIVHAPLNTWDFTSTPIWDATTGFFPTLHAISADDHEGGLLFAGGDGSSGDPYQISSCAQFENISQVPTSAFILQNNLDCSDSSYGNNIMVGSGVSPFAGVFNGQGHTITIALSDPDGNFDNIGLFANTNGALISNLNVAGTINAIRNVGALASYAEFTAFDNDSSSVTVTIGDNDGWEPEVGDLVGYSYENTISNSWTIGTLTSSGSVDGIGGLVGYAESSSIVTSYSTGSVVVNNDDVGNGVGGLVGATYDSTDISQSYALGAVSDDTGYYVGGLVGGGENSTIEDSYATGNIRGNGYVGGVVGWADSYEMDRVYSTGSVTGIGDGAYEGGGLSGYFYYDTLNDSFSTGYVSGFSTNMGGLVGLDDGSNGYNDDYYDQITSGQTGCTQNGDNEGCLGIDTVGYPSPNYFKGNSSNSPLRTWDFESVWNTNSNLYPTLKTISIDQIIPVITLLGAPHVIVYQNQSYTDAGATAHDNLDGNITNSIVVNNSVNTSTIGTYTVTYNVSDSSHNPASEVSRTVEVFPANISQTVGSTSTDMDIYIPQTVTNGTLDLSASQTGTTTVTISHNITIHADTNTGAAIVSLPAGISITSDSGSWNGVVNLPQPQINPVVTPSSGNTASVDSSLEVGLGDTKTTFDKGVRLLFPGKAGMFVGWTRGGVFTPIVTACIADSQDAGDALPTEGDCKMNSGGDLVVWTKHFTTYVVYTEAPIIVPQHNTVNNSSGGGFSVAIVQPTPISSASSLDFIINEGTGKTSSPVVLIVMNASTSTVSGYAISTKPTFPENIINPYANPAIFKLPSSEGTYTIYLKYYSTTGTPSNVISHTVMYVAGPASSQISPVVASPSYFVFTRTLKQGSTGPDVKALQQFLNTHGFVIAKTGAGSPGRENSTFGAGTVNALKKYQKYYGISPNGIFGPVTLASINKIQAKTSSVISSPEPVSKPKPATSTTTKTVTSHKELFTMDLQVGMINPEVVLLQKFLNTHGYIVATTGLGSPGKENKAFGPGTQKALAQYQKDHGIKPAQGSLGPTTRAYINSHQ